MNKLTFILLLCLNPFAEKKTDYVKLSHKISDPFVAESKKKRGLTCIGSGGAFYTNVKEVVLSFHSNFTVSLPEARRAFIEMTEDLIARYNAYEPIRPYMDNFPFTPKNIEVSILFGKKNNDNGEIIVSGVLSVNGFVFYTMVPPNSSSEIAEFAETYNEAYRIVFGKDRDPPVELTPPRIGK